MTVSFMTKYGRRRIKHDPPTLEEALVAAECMTDDFDQKVEIAAALMGLPIEEVRAKASRPAPRTTSLPVFAGRGRPSRSVVVERKKARRPGSQARA